MKVVHIQTTLQTIFGFMDDDGDIVYKQPVTIEVEKPTQEAFQQLLAQLAKVREDLANQGPPPKKV